MSREDTLWTWLKGARPILRERLHLTRIENAVGSGAPDVEGCLDGTQLWIELKSEARPARSDTKVRFKVRDSQVEWHRRRREANGRSWLLVQVYGKSDRGIYLLDGSLAGVLEDGMDEITIANAALTWRLDQPEQWRYHVGPAACLLAAANAS